jgi:hypothetical protein
VTSVCVCQRVPVEPGAWLAAGDGLISELHLIENAEKPPAPVTWPRGLWTPKLVGLPRSSAPPPQALGEGSVA